MLIVGFLFAPKKLVIDGLDDLRRRTRIRCPQCQWEPRPQDTWCCSPGCGHVWNTFETRALCPGCNTQWTHTACLRCNGWFPHDDWYEQESD